MATTETRKLNPWWVATVSGMASYLDAAAITGFAVALVVYQRELGFGALEYGIAASAMALGVALGALVGGRLGDRLGRRPVFTATMILVLAAVILLIVAPSFPILLVGASVLGLAIGADLPVSLSTISEAATDENRGKLLGFSNLLWLAGAIIGGISAGIVGDLGRPGLFIIFGHIGIVTLLVLIGRLTIPESETWLAAKAERRAGIATVRADRASVRELFRAPYAAPFIALIVFYFLVGIFGFVGGQFNSLIYTEYGGATLASTALIGLVVIPFGIGAFLWFMRIADKPVRFTYFVVGAVLNVIAPLITVFFGVNLITGAIGSAVAAIGGAFAFEGIMKIWTQQSFPVLLRTTAQGAVLAFARVSYAVIAVLVPIALVTLGPQLVFAIMAVCSLVGSTVAFVVFRTRDQISEFDLEAEPDPEAQPSVVHTAS